MKICQWLVHFLPIKTACGFKVYLILFIGFAHNMYVFKIVSYVTSDLSLASKFSTSDSCGMFPSRSKINIFDQIQRSIYLKI